MNSDTVENEADDGLLRNGLDGVPLHCDGSLSYSRHTWQMIYACISWNDATSALGPYHAYGEHFCWGRRHLVFSFYCSQMFSMSGERERELASSIYHILRREMFVSSFVFCSLFFMQTGKRLFHQEFL